MSWAVAQKEADRLLQRIPLPDPIKGGFVNLDLYRDTIDGTEGFKLMVLRAACRKLQQRGASVFFTSPDG